MSVLEWLSEHWLFVLMWLAVLLQQYEHQRASWVRYKLIADALDIDDPDIENEAVRKRDSRVTWVIILVAVAVSVALRTILGD